MTVFPEFPLDAIGVNDAVYDGVAWPAILAKFPAAVREDASDDIHPDRIRVVIPDISWRDYFLHALDEGYFTVSFTFQLLVLDQSEESEFKKLVRGWIDARKEEIEAAKGGAE